MLRNLYNIVSSGTGWLLHEVVEDGCEVLLALTCVNAVCMIHYITYKAPRGLISLYCLFILAMLRLSSGPSQLNQFARA